MSNVGCARLELADRAYSDIAPSAQEYQLKIISGAAVLHDTSIYITDDRPGELISPFL